MNAQEISIKHSALGWVKKSIDDNLSEIKVDLKQYIEAEDAELLLSVQRRLGVVEGVLKMIEQYGAAMLTEEMLALAEFIARGEQDKGDQALEVLLRAVLQLPDYLEHIQSGHHDIPIAILPLLKMAIGLSSSSLCALIPTASAAAVARLPLLKIVIALFAARVRASIP